MRREFPECATHEGTFEYHAVVIAWNFSTYPRAEYGLRWRWIRQWVLQTHRWIVSHPCVPDKIAAQPRPGDFPLHEKGLEATWRD